MVECKYAYIELFRKISHWFLLCRTGVRLGDFTQKPYCDYGSENCSLYKHFGIEATKVHENYMKDSETIALYNDIALLRLDRNVIFGEVMRPVCLPFNAPELTPNSPLMVSGWGATLDLIDKPLKRSVAIPLWKECDMNSTILICAGYVSSRSPELKVTCSGDSGGPLMNTLNSRMVIEGIVSFSEGNYGNNFFPPYFTCVREFLDWIENNMYME